MITRNLADRYHWHPDRVFGTAFRRLLPFLRPAADRSRGRLVPLEKLPPGTREAVLNRTRARKGLPPVKPRP